MFIGSEIYLTNIGGGKDLALVKYIEMNNQGRRRLLESGTAIERFRLSPSAEGTSGGRAREGVRPPLVKGVWGSPP